MDIYISAISRRVREASEKRRDDKEQSRIKSRWEVFRKRRKKRSESAEIRGISWRRNFFFPFLSLMAARCLFSVLWSRREKWEMRKGGKRCAAGINFCDSSAVASLGASAAGRPWRLPPSARESRLADRQKSSCAFAAAPTLLVLPTLSSGNFLNATKLQYSLPFLLPSSSAALFADGTISNWRISARLAVRLGRLLLLGTAAWRGTDDIRRRAKIAERFEWRN